MIELGEITLLNIITISFSLIAICISIYSIYRNNQNQKRQLKIGKIEEILEIHSYLNNSYYYIYNASAILEKIFEEREYAGPAVLATYDFALKKHTEDLIANIKSEEKFNKKCERLEVLSKCYILDRDLCVKVICYTHYLKLLLSDVMYNHYSQEDSQVSILPTPMKFHNFMYITENALIKEMNLKTRVPTKSTIKKYRISEFNKDLGYEI